MEMTLGHTYRWHATTETLVVLLQNLTHFRGKHSLSSKHAK